jgi:hypothetical protein
MGDETMDVYVSLTQAEALTGIDRVTLWRMCRRRILPYRRRGRLYELCLRDVRRLASVAHLVRSAKHSTIRQAFALARAGVIPEAESETS